MSIDDVEQRLRSSLDRQADSHSACEHGADLADVFTRARRIRRRRTALIASAAAVAVAAIAVPAGVLMGSRDTGAPPPPISTVSSVPTPTSAPTRTTSEAGLGGLAMGTPTTLTYIDPTGTMHGGQQLPDPARGGDLARSPVMAFTPYHGGWLVNYADANLKQFDSSGAVVHSWTGPSAIALSDDGTETAWQVGHDVYVGSSSGMAEGEGHWRVKASEGLVGFLPQGPVVSDTTGYTVLTGATSRQGISSEITPTTASQTADAIGGVVGTVAHDDQQGALADARTGALYWKGAWMPLSFSPDGKYVAAVPVADNGDPSAVAILDSRTGALIARTPDVTGRLYLGKNMAWDDDRLVFDVASGDGQDAQALVALRADGRLEQVSPTLSAPNMDTFPGAGGFIFMTR